MVHDAKAVAMSPTDHAAISRWRESNKAVRYPALYVDSRLIYLY